MILLLFRSEMNKLKIFKDLFIFCNNADSNQKSLHFSSSALPPCHSSLIQTIKNQWKEVSLKMIGVTHFVDHLTHSNSHDVTLKDFPQKITKALIRWQKKPTIKRKKIFYNQRLLSSLSLNKSFLL